MAPTSMHFFSLFLGLLVFPLSLLPLISSTPTLLAKNCFNDSVLSPNSAYQSNLNTLLQSLSSNSTSNPVGYFSTSVGTNTDAAVYGFFLCRGDQNATECGDCVSTATTTDLPKKYCPLSKVAVIWYEQCMVRYSNQPLVGSLNTFPSEVVRGPENLVGNRTQFVEIMGDAVDKATSEAAGDESGKKYGTGIRDGGKFGQIYVLVQCTPDLSSSDCVRCLNTAVGAFPFGYDESASGGTSLTPNCFAQYGTHRFFNVEPINTTNGNLITGQTGKKRGSTGIIIAIVVPIAILVTLLGICRCVIKRKIKEKNYDAFPTESAEALEMASSLQYDLETLKYATNNFSEDNKLGEGGFGGVYKGILTNGQEIAVKRLSRSSTQGSKEFKNEVLLVAKLQHKNLVRLLGFCLAREEKLLVYEFVHNKSLNYFLFDPKKQGELDWKARYKIIRGIAQGMLYLHQDSWPRIVHRDLKASNVLLDADMNPKISDFGMARIFGMDEQANTNRIVGTYGYMAPEYALRGLFSAKTDVYSFGVLVLEIISGQRNNDFYISGYEDFLGYAWRLWKDEAPFEFLDPTIRGSFSTVEVMRCLQIGLLCVQHSVEKRPTMATVVCKLDNFSDELSAPQKPTFYVRNRADTNSTNESGSYFSTDDSMLNSVNIVSISGAEPR